jgi:DNA-binding MarR family transcriptional regulator
LADPEAQDLAAELRAAVLGLARELRTLAGEHGLTPTQTSVLGLVERRGPLRASDIATAEGLNPTLVSRVLGHLEGGGHLTRAPDASDARAARIDVSASGRALAVRVRERRTRWLEERLGCLSAEERESLLAALPALRALARGERDGGVAR